MAPNVSVYFYAANDLNGDPLGVITDEDEYFKGFQLKPDLYGLGGWELVLARRVGFAGFSSGMFASEVFVRILVHAFSDTAFFFGGPLEKRNQVVVDVDEDGGEEFHFGGPGPKAYLDRARTRIESFTDSDWHLDLAAGLWRWKITATWTGVMRRLLLEDAASDAPALPDLTFDFTFADDSDGATADEVGGADEYEIPIGQTYLEALWDLEDAGFGISTVDLGTVASPQYLLQLHQVYGSDVTGSSFASGVGLLREGVNIADDSLDLDGVALRKCTHVIVEGKDSTWVMVAKPSWDPGEYVKIGKISYTRTKNTTVLERVGLRWLRRQDNGDQEIIVEFLPGHSDADGLYFPQDGPLALGNSISVDTTADGTTHTPIDLQPSEPQLVTGFELTLGPASRTDTALAMDRSWQCKVKLNQERAGNAQSPNQSSATTSGSCNCPVHNPAPGTDGTPGTGGTTDLSLHWDWETNNKDSTGTYAFLDRSTNSNLVRQGSGVGWCPPAANRSTDRIPCAAGKTVQVSFRTAAQTAAEKQTRTFHLRYFVHSAVNYFAQEVITVPPSSGGGGPVQSMALSYVAPAGTDEITLHVYNGVWMDPLDITIGTPGTPAVDPTPSPDLPAGYVVGPGQGFFGESPKFIPLGSALEHQYIDTTETQHNAKSITYDNTDSGLTAADVKEAIDEVAATAGGGSYTDEQAQDAVGAMLADTATVDLTYTDATPQLKADVIPGGIKLDDLGVPDDTTDLDASTSKHGLLPKLPGGTSGFLRADGTFATPPGTAPTIANVFVGTIDPYQLNSSATSMTANAAYGGKFVPLSDVTVSTVHFRVAAQAGNLDFGIYDASGNRLGSTGSFACPAVGIASRALTASVSLTAGQVYYLVTAGSSSAMRMPVHVQSAGTLLSHGWNLRGSATASFPLPDPITLVFDNSSTLPLPVIIFI